MNEQRSQAYIELVQKLLNCSDGEENQVLQQFPELLDKGLVQFMEQAIAVLQQQKRFQEAAKLENLVRQIVRAAGVTEDLRAILQELSQPVQDSRQIEKRVQLCQRALVMVTRHENEELWAILQNELGNSLRQHPRGDRSENIEQAIVAFNQALKVITYEDFPEHWVGIQNNLAIAHRKRIRGNHADNIEQSISLLKKILKIVARKDFPERWADTQSHLANAYCDRIRGKRSDNLNLAVIAFKRALEVFTRADFPNRWADIQNNLANAYFNFISGGRAKNLENAITALQDSLKIRNRVDFPEKWMETQGNLAIAYQNRIYGDRADNIEQSIIICQQALNTIDHKELPNQWLVIQNTLAIAYRKRIYGNRVDNIKQGIIAYEHALKVRIREALPKQWAMIQGNLAVAYIEINSFEKALSCCERALEVYTREDFPSDWAMLQNHLGLIYSRLTLDDRAANLEKAIVAYNKALGIYTREDFPEEWAGTKHNLAIIYCKETNTNTIEQAIIHCKQALEVRKPEAYPYECLQTSSLLAKLYANLERWLDATTTYTTALAAAATLYQAAISKDSQEAELEEIKDLNRQATYAYAKVGSLKAAVVTVERGRARSLSETLQRDRADFEAIRKINPSLVERYETTANAIRLLESTGRRKDFDSNQPQYSREDFRNQATQAHQSLQDCLTEIRQIPGYESFLALPTFEDIAATLQLNQPLIYLLHTPNGSLALVITIDGITDLWLNDLKDEKLIDLLDNIWFKTYSQSQSNRKGWLQAIDQVTQQLWDWLMVPVVNHLQQHNLQRAILIPTGYLSFLPLHAAWTEDNSSTTERRYPFEEIQFTYSPNALSLKAGRTVAAQTPANKLLAINEPLPVNASHLPSSSFETAKAVSTFPGKANFKILQHEAATPVAVLNALPNYSTLHLSCHGSVNFQTPLDSSLLMANDEALSLRDLLDLKLKGLRLAILSACETGIPGTKLPDEVISLPTGLLQAGAAGVISSLWSVSDLSTMLLLSRFYDLWRSQNPDATPLEPPEALRQAQLWLRDSTGPELAPYLQTSHPELVAKLEQAKDKRPFAHPFHWAAFTYTGV